MRVCFQPNLHSSGTSLRLSKESSVYRGRKLARLLKGPLPPLVYLFICLLAFPRSTHLPVRWLVTLVMEARGHSAYETGDFLSADKRST